MSFIWNLLKKTFFWSYARNTWQWDVLCVLILIFIFLTPKQWFTNGERHRPLERRSAASATLQLRADGVDYEHDLRRLEERVRAETGRPEAQIVSVRPQHEGNTIVGYEVDIR